MHKKLHILFLCGWYPSRVLPTNGDFIQRHAQAVSLVHKVSVLHIISDEKVNRTEYFFKNDESIETHIAYVKKTNNPILKLIRFWKAYLNLIRKIKDVDFVHLNTLYPFGVFALHYKFIKKKSYIISEHWTGYHKSQHKNFSFLHKIASKIICKNASNICPVSKNLGLNMQKIGLVGNYYPIPNVVDTSLFFPIEKPKNTLNVLHISNMKDGQKNISGLLNAFRNAQSINKNLSFTIIGEESIKYKKIAYDIGIRNIEFIDQIEQSKLNSYFSKAKVFVLFSNTENLPCVILESFASGTPVISTNVGGIAEFFPTNFGILIEKGNEEQLVNELNKVVNDEISFAKPSEMFNYAELNFGKEKICNQFSKLYYKALTN